MSWPRTAFGRHGIASWTIGLVFAFTVGPGSALVLWLVVLGVSVDQMGGPLERVFICSIPFAALLLWALHAVSKEYAFARRVTIAFFIWLELLLLLMPPSAVQLGLLSPADLAVQNTLAMTAIFAALSLMIYRKALHVARKRNSSGAPTPQL